MSPTSYRAAPPRTFSLPSSHRWVNPLRGISSPAFPVSERLNSLAFSARRPFLAPGQPPARACARTPHRDPSRFLRRPPRPPAAPNDPPANPHSSTEAKPREGKSDSPETLHLHARNLGTSAHSPNRPTIFPAGVWFSPPVAPRFGWSRLQPAPFGEERRHPCSI